MLGGGFLSPYLGSLDKLVDLVGKIPLVLRLVLEVLARHLDLVALGVVPHAGELLQLELLLGGEAEVGRAEGDDDLALGRVELAEVGGVAVAEDLVLLGGLEGLCEFWSGRGFSG